MQLTAEPIARLIEEFTKLPGIGPKTAQRLTYYLLRVSAEEASALAQAIVEVREKTTFCSVCYNITETDPCSMCCGRGRDETKICVVEEPLDVMALERTREYSGLYHVLHGAISPVDGIGPEDLKMRELLRRLSDHKVEDKLGAPRLPAKAPAAYLRL